MDAKVKAKWLKALRSNKYKQGKAALAQRTTNGKFNHCCLGVLCAITPEVKSVGLDHEGRRGYRYKGSTSSAYLPVKFREVLGLDPDSETGLAQMNDDGEPFAEIADWIEENL